MLEPVEHGNRATLPNLSGSTVGRFTIGERLGQGGMGEVYRAEDSILRRPVAIKRITPLLSANEQYRTRLLKEAERASSLSNQHIAVVHDVLEDQGSMFLVMEYVDGQTLRVRMQSPLSLEVFYDIAEQCVRGIAAAHQNGILHCDIKPENIMVNPRGQVKILDFGLAKQLPRDPDATLDEIASTSSFSGTLAYMAPEVLLENPPDARSDIFSLGVVFYEVLAKRHPFRVESFIGTSDRILREEPAPIEEGVPAALECLVLKMLSKDPAERPNSAEEVLRELATMRQGARSPSGVAWAVWRMKLRQNPARYYLTSGIIVIGILIGGLTAVKVKFPKRNVSSVTTAPLPEMRQLAVLPFRTAELEGGARAYGLGLAEILTTRLAELSIGMPLQVVSSGDIRSQAIITAEQAKTHYGANLVLEGNFSRAGTMIRVHYTLVDPEDRRILRAGMISGDTADPFAMEDRVVESVLKSLELELTKNGESANIAARTQQPQAYDYFLRGRGYLQEYDRPENIDNAIQEFQRSLARDPEYALAFAGLGESYRHKYEITRDAAWMKRGQEACRKASQLAPKLPDGHICLGIISTHTGKYEDAVAEFKQALAIDARNDRAQVELALALERLGKMDEAEATYKNAASMRPQYWSPHNRLGRFYLARGRYSEAIKKFEQVIQLAPESFRGYSNLGAVFLMTGRYAEAVPRLEKSVAIRPNAAASNNLGAAYFYMGRYEEAANAYEKAAELDPKDYAIVGNVAEAYYWAPNQREKAMQNYRKALGMAKKSLETNSNHELNLRAVALYSAMLNDRAAAIEYDAKARLAAGPQGRDPESSLSSAIIYAKLGDHDTTFRYLKEAVARGIALERIMQSPNFDHLQKDPRMKELRPNAK
ncbi:MAG TPA: tetratricopeptide repeat protein [Terriglobales bacterium]|nr:tetratricopeptide repeat protein [Terriglobales bacterium]